VQGIDANGDPASLPSGLGFVSSDTTIAAVDAVGNVLSGSAQGTATITVTIDTFTVQVPVIVAQIPTSILVSPRSVVFASSGAQQLTPTVLDLYGTPISGASFTYQGDSPSRFTVSGTGLVTSLGPTGNGIVTVTSGAVSTPVNVFIGSGPFGTIVERTAVPASAYAAAVSPSGAMIVSLASNTAGLRGDLPSYALSTISAISDPLGVAINPAGTLGYFAQRGNGNVAVLNLATNQLQAPITGAAGQAFTVVASPDGQFLFVGATDNIYKFDASSGALLDSAAIGAATHLAPHPTMALLYLSTDGGLVAELNTATMAQTRTFAGAVFPKAVAVAPDGSELYVADENSMAVMAFTLSTGLAATSFAAGNPTFGLAVNRTLLVATGSGAGQVRAFNRVSRAVVYSVATGGIPRRPAFDATGTILVVPNEGGWVDFVR